MNRLEFATVMGYLAVAINKPLSEQAHEVYFDLLGDLPLPVLQMAAKRVALEHKWATFPSVAELREAAVLTMQGESAEISPAEAWHLAWRAAGKLDPDSIHSDGEYISNGKRYANQFEAVIDGMPPRVVEAMRAFAINALCYGKEPVGVIRGQFIKIYEQLLARDKRMALLPAAMRQAIAEQDKPALPKPTHKLISEIGKMPPDTS